MYQLRQNDDYMEKALKFKPILLTQQFSQKKKIYSNSLDN